MRPALHFRINMSASSATNPWGTVDTELTIVSSRVFAYPITTQQDTTKAEVTQMYLKETLISTFPEVTEMTALRDMIESLVLDVKRTPFDKMEDLGHVLKAIDNLNRIQTLEYYNIIKQ